MTLEKLSRENGHINHGGKEYVLIRQAYIDGPVDDPYYTASAIIPAAGPDGDGLYPVYILTWYPLQSWLDGDRDDEGDACDWGNPDEVDKITIGYDLAANRII